MLVQMAGDSMAVRENFNQTGVKVHVGAVSYLNTKPLIEGIQQQYHWIDLSVDLPSRLADQLRSGKLDVALIPSIEFFRGDDYTIVSDACIASIGPVWSVKLLFRVPPQEVKSLALDEGSRTSATLARILLKREYGVVPELRPLPIQANWETADADAVLIIGDRAMKPISSDWYDSWDIGQKWREHSGSPCVFAMWVARRGFESAELGEILSQARDKGLSHAEKIASRECEGYGLSQSMCLRYFREFLHFHLGHEERDGLTKFYEAAVELGLAPAGKLPFRYAESVK